MSQLELDPAHHTSLLQRLAAPAPLGARLSCRPGQAAVFVVRGRAVGVLGPGEHVLDPRFIAFLGPALQQRPHGPVVGEDLYFAKLGATVELGFGGALKTRIDASLGERFTPRFSATLVLGLADAARAVALFHGKATSSPEQEARARAEPVIVGELEKLTLLTELTRPERWRDASEAAGRLLGPELAELGLSLVSLTVTSVSLPDDVAARVRLSGSTLTHPGTDVTAARLEVGARVRTSHDGSWYSGRVVSVADASAEIEWDGAADRSWVPEAVLEPEPRYPGSHAPGTKVVARRSDGSFWPGTVRAFNGTSYFVAWDDGTSGWVSPGELQLL